MICIESEFYTNSVMKSDHQNRFSFNLQMKLASFRLLNSPSCHDLFGQVGRRMGKRKGQHDLKRPYKIQGAWKNFQPLLYIFILLLGLVLYSGHCIAGGNLYLGAKMNARLCSLNFMHVILGISNHAKVGGKGGHGYCNWKPSHVGSDSVHGAATLEGLEHHSQSLQTSKPRECTNVHLIFINQLVKTEIVKRFQHTVSSLAN